MTQSGMQVDNESSGMESRRRAPGWSALLALLVLLCWVGDSRGEDASTWTPPRSPASLPVSGTDGVRLEGMSPTAQLPVYLPESWILTGSGRLTLYLEHSELLRDSSLTLQWNGVEVASTRLEAAKATLTVPIPSDYFVPGWNTLQVQTSLRIHADPCRDLDNPGLWLRILPTSRLEIPFALRPALPDLARFPASYTVPDGPDRPASILFMLPQALSARSLEVAGLLAARWGQQRTLPPQQVRGAFLREQRPEGLGSAHLVFVGSLAEVDLLTGWGIDTQEIHQSFDRLRAERGSPARAVGLFERVSPHNPYRRLLVALAADTASLPILSAWLRKGPRWEPLMGDSVLLVTEPERASVSGTQANHLPFSELGLGAISLRGLSRPQQELRIEVPRHWRLTPEATLQLYLTHSLSQRRSATLEVEVDGVPAGSLELLPALGEDEGYSREIQVPLPRQSLASGILSLRFRYFLDLESDDCARPYDESNWVVIEPRSYLYLAHELSRKVDLADYPDRFASRPALQESGILLGRGSEDAGLSTALTVAANLGSQVPRASIIDLAMQTGDGFRELGGALRAGRDWILVAQSADEPLLPELQRLLYARLDKEKGVIPQAQLEPLPEGASRAGVLQAVRSPWEAQRVLLVAMAPSAAGLEKIRPLLGQSWYDGRLSGDLTLVTDSGTLHSYALTPAESPAGPATVAPRREGWVWLLLSLVGLVLAMAVYRSVSARL